MRNVDRFLIAAFAIFLGAALGAAPAFGQELSRWALGRPSLLIDMPGNPSAGAVTWAERPMYSVFPSSWSAEGGGVRIEVARVFTGKGPTELLSEIGQKVSTPMIPRNRGKISGREFVNFLGPSRMAAVIGTDSGVLGGASWVVMATYRDQNGQALASSIFDSIKVEREGNRHWAIRSFGPTFLASELPFELTPVTSPGDKGAARYESSFDGMDVTASSENPDAGMLFQPENSIKGMIERESSRPGVTNFTSKRDKFKIDDRDGEIITMDFKRGSRNYRIFKFAFITKQSAVVAGAIIDPNRSDHLATMERILRGFRTTTNPVYGWKTYAIGNDGLYVDLPVAPGPPKQQNSVTIYESNTPLAMAEIRELEVAYPGAHDPDFSAKQYFEFQTALSPNQKFEMQGIDKLVIDGLEARLVRATWQNGKDTNQRQILTIYGYRKQWIIDMLAARDTKLYMERVMQSVRVKLGHPGMRRQSFGETGVSFIVGRDPIKVNVNSAGTNVSSREENAYTEFEGGLMVVYEMVLKEKNLPIADDQAKHFVDSLLGGVASGGGVKITSSLRSGHPVNIDGVEGRHIILDLQSDRAKAGSKIQGDFIVLQQGQRMWTLFVMTNYEAGNAARENRARILNSLRVGI